MDKPRLLHSLEKKTRSKLKKLNKSKPKRKKKKRRKKRRLRKRGLKISKQERLRRKWRK